VIRKTSKSKTTTHKFAKKRNLGKSKIELNPASVRKDIAQMVASEATTMAQAVIDEGKKGQLATVKYLFEVAEIYPASTDGSFATTDEDCLARTLLNRMDVPDEPVARDEEDEPKAATSANKPAGKPADKDEGDSGAEPKAENENRELVLV
jgi:hypothetical protein